MNELWRYYRKKVIARLDSNPFIKNVALKSYYWFFPGNQLSYWILKLNNNNPVTVVQIGSNDGSTGDPIFDIALRSENWNLLLVEPIPYLFEKLKENYPKEPRFKFQNAAINDGTLQKFFFISEGAFKNKKINNPWYKQIGSFRKEHLKKHFNFNVEKYIEEIEIQGLTLEQLFVRNNIEKLDFLHIDAEGYDWKILSQLNLNKYRPQLILFEHKHLKLSEKNNAINYLDNYKIFQFTGDYLCILKANLSKKDFKKISKRAVN